MKKRKEDIRCDVCRNSRIRGALDLFVKQLNTPEKVDDAYQYLKYGDKSKYVMPFVLLSVIGAEMDLIHFKYSPEITEPLAELCLLLGSPDNCRIVCCAIPQSLLLPQLSLNERDSGNAEWHWIMDAYWAVSHLVDGIVKAKMNEEDEKAKEVAK